MRALMRETAQPVAVVTSVLAAPDSIPGLDSDPPQPLSMHGATLSSLTSIAMDPHPLVSFALRLPSRMATALHAAYQSDPHQQHSSPPHMVINLLSATQAPLAVRFSRPDLYPSPFANTPHWLTGEGLPVLEHALGALSCRLVSPPIPLHDLDYLRRKYSEAGSSNSSRESEDGDGIASELYVAQVVRVEGLGTRLGEDDGEADTPRTLPLLYHRRGYTTCQDVHTYTKLTRNWS